MIFYAHNMSLLLMQQRKSGQSSLAKAASKSMKEIDRESSLIYHNVSQVVSERLHPKQDLDPFSLVCTA